MNNPLDKFLQSIPMYRLVLYGLVLLLIISTFLANLGYFSFSSSQLLFSASLLSLSCLLINWGLALLYQTPANSESSLISGLILACILPPPVNQEQAFLWILIALLAMASKYVLAWGHKHIFNPVALAVAGAGLMGIVQADWWIGSSILLPFTLGLSFLIIRKVNRVRVALFFTAMALLIIGGFGLLDKMSLFESLAQGVTSWPLVFFAGVMLTEPLTMPIRSKDQYIYAAGIGLLIASRWHVGPIYSTPEIALLLGNLFSFVQNYYSKPTLVLKERNQLTDSLYELVFDVSHPLHFKPGQYLELTIGHFFPDLRGNRRMFTISSSPTEQNLKFGIKIPASTSSFKKALLNLPLRTRVGIGALGGSFTLPDSPSVKLAFLAGGIGVTPFRSMAAYMLDKKLLFNCVLVQAVNKPEELIYKDVFTKATAQGLKHIPLIADDNKNLEWQGIRGRISEDLIRKEIPDFGERIFYLSGPPAFVNFCKSALKNLSVKSTNIKTDYFAGY